MTMRRALGDPALLGHVLQGDSWLAWRALLIASNGEALTDEERGAFNRLTGREREPLEPCEELWVVAGRRGGKSRAAAVLAIYQAVFIDHSKVMVVGERPVVLILAQNQQQAKVVFGYIDGIFAATPLLVGLVTGRFVDTLTLKNNIDIVVRAASFRGIRGTTSVAVIADEACFWLSEDGRSVNTDFEIINAVRPSLATTRGPLIVISSPYARRGAVFETWQRHFGEKGDPRVLVAQGASRDFNPSLPQSVVDRAMERDPIAASAEYGGLFRSDLEAFVNREAVEACVSLGVYERAPLSSIWYSGFVDPSGGSADSMTLGIAHRERDLVILDVVREVKPPFSPEGVVSDFAATLKPYRVTTIRGDRYAGEWPREQFRKFGIRYEPSERNRSEIYGELLPLINSRRVDLLDDKRMIAQLVQLERRTSRAGRDAIDHAPGQHDDRINAAAGAIVLAATGRRPMVISDELLRRISEPALWDMQGGAFF